MSRLPRTRRIAGRRPARSWSAFFHLDDADRTLIESKRRSHNRLGYAAQLTTARYLGVFLDDPTDVPAAVVDYLAEQLDIGNLSVLKAYGERENTRLEHVRELRRVLEYREFAAEAELRVWVDARAWTTGEGPKALFDAAAGWLRERRVLLPGVTTLTRLVASVREAANQRLWDTLYGLLNTGQRAVLDSLLMVPPGERVSELDRLRRGPVRVSGPQMKWALQRAEEIAGLGMGELDVSAIPPRRLAELSRYGVDGKASLLRRHGDSRRLATLLATTVYLTTRAVDDALDLLGVLIATKLLAKAERETAKEKMKTLPRVERASAKLATAFQVVFDTTSELVDTDTGEVTGPQVESFEAMWEQIEAVVPPARAGRRDRRAVRADAAAGLRRGRDVAVHARGSVRHRPAVPEALGPGRRLRRHSRGCAGSDRAAVAAGPDGPQEGRPGRDRHRPARRLVAASGALRPAPGAGNGGLEGVHVLRAGAAAPDAAKQAGLAKNSSKWGDPRAKLLDGEAWEQARPTVLAFSDCPGRRASTWRRGPRCWTARTARSPPGCRTTRRSSSTTTAGCTSPHPNRRPCSICGRR
nr:DUF4158 domain-containing protein [Streptomyces sp. DH7]